MAPDRARPAKAVAPFGLTRLEVRGFRSITSLSLSPRRVCALVGEASAGKSNLLAAIRGLLDPAAPPLEEADVAHGSDGTISTTGWLATGKRLSIRATPPGPTHRAGNGTSSVLLLSADTRSGPMLARGSSGSMARKALELFDRALADHLGRPRAVSAAAPALGLVDAMESCCAFGVRGIVLLIEEPELYLRPQAQRYLYRLLRAFAAGGNQVFYSTHSPAFLNVARLEELVLVVRDDRGTRVVQPTPAAAEEELRLRSEFDAERSELFLARSAMLVEGQTEKLAMPFVFQALGHDVDREGISIVECGGKSGIPLVGRVCNAVGVPFVAVHDLDARPGLKPIVAEQTLNELIASVAGKERTVVLEPDFEGVSSLRGASHKPERAWRRFTSLAPSEMPEPLVRAARLAIALAGGPVGG